MTIQRARELLGDQVKESNDEQLLEFMQQSKVIVAAIFDDIINMTPEERNSRKL